jgi:hypothetical protein
MAKQQHQNPAQGTSSTSKRSHTGPARGGPADEGMDTTHRAGHVSSTDSMYGTHSSLGGVDERGDRPARAAGGNDPSGREHAQAQDPSARVRPGEAQGRSKYSPTGGEQDRLSRQQGGEPLRQPAPTGTETKEGEQSVPADSAARDPKDETSGRRSDQRAAPARRNPREGGHGAAGDDSPTVRSAADRGSKLTATHDIDLAGPDRSGTKRDR